MGIKKLTGNGGAKPSKRKPGTQAKEVKKAKKVVTTAKDFGRPQVARPIMPVSAKKAAKIKKANDKQAAANKNLAKAPTKKGPPKKAKTEMKEPFKTGGNSEKGFWQKQIAKTERRVAAWEKLEKAYLANLKKLARKKSPEGKEAKEALKRLEEVAELGRKRGLESKAIKARADYSEPKIKSSIRKPSQEKKFNPKKTEINLPSLTHYIPAQAIKEGLELANLKLVGTSKKQLADRCQDSAKQFLDSIRTIIKTEKPIANGADIKKQTKNLPLAGFENQIAKIGKAMRSSFSASDIVLLSIVSVANQISTKHKIGAMLAKPKQRKSLLESIKKDTYELVNPYNQALEEFDVSLSNSHEISKLALIYLSLEKGVLGFDDAKRAFTVMPPPIE